MFLHLSTLLTISQRYQVEYNILKIYILCAVELFFCLLINVLPWVWGGSYWQLKPVGKKVSIYFVAPTL